MRVVFRGEEPLIRLFVKAPSPSSREISDFAKFDAELGHPELRRRRGPPKTPPPTPSRRASAAVEIHALVGHREQLRHRVVGRIATGLRS